MPREINRIRAEGTAWRLTQDYCLDSPGPTPVVDIDWMSGTIGAEGKARPN